MNNQKLEILLQRYFEGDTSLEEERLLKQCFLDEEVPAHLKKFRSLFVMLSDEANRTSAREATIEEPATPWYQRGWWRNAAVAASVMILLGLGLFIDSRLQKVSDQEVLGAYKKTHEAILRASSYLATGKEEAKQIQRFNKAIEQAQPVYNVTKTMAEMQKLEKLENQMDKTRLIYKYTNYQPFKTE